jgi:hypothetical protein
MTRAADARYRFVSKRLFAFVIIIHYARDATVFFAFAIWLRKLMNRMKSAAIFLNTASG